MKNKTKSTKVYLPLRYRIEFIEKKVQKEKQRIEKEIKKIEKNAESFISILESFGNRDTRKRRAFISKYDKDMNKYVLLRKKCKNLEAELRMLESWRN